MNLFERTKEELWRRRDKLLKGGYNCIPWGLPRFEQSNPGIEQRNYYMVSASPKIGKSQICDALFLHNAYSFVEMVEEDIDIHIKYFSLEMSEEQKIQQCLSHRLYVDSGGKIRVSPRELRSTQTPLSTEITELIKTYTPYFEKFLSKVQFISHIRNPYGIFKEMETYAAENGKQHKKSIFVTEDGVGGAKIKREKLIDDYYEPNNPDEYTICIVDHASLIHPEKGVSLHQAMSDLSARHFVRLRNKYNYIPVLIQQQAADQESVKNIEMNKLRPSFTGLADNKLTSRDIDVGLGLFSPARHEIPSYGGYDIRYFKDNIRFLEIMGGREGGGGKIAPLYFDGAVNFFKELPKPDDEDQMKNVYNLIKTIRK